jgi:hypothetical protein
MNVTECCQSLKETPNNNYTQEKKQIFMWIWTRSVHVEANRLNRCATAKMCEFAYENIKYSNPSMRTLCLRFNHGHQWICSGPQFVDNLADNVFAEFMIGSKCQKSYFKLSKNGHFGFPIRCQRAVPWDFDIDVACVHTIVRSSYFQNRLKQM